ncbi:MAG: hypothetical protein WAK17_11890 [Candidatus Nitrosopolaris sp.]
MCKQTGTKGDTICDIELGNNPVEWDIKINGLYRIFTGMIKRHILKGTEEALERISEKVSYASA